MKEFVFTVIKTGYVNVEAESFEDAEAILQENLGHFYVSTDGSQEPADGWETTGEIELDPECAFNDYEEEEV